MTPAVLGESSSAFGVACPREGGGEDRAILADLRCASASSPSLTRLRQGFAGRGVSALRVTPPFASQPSERLDASANARHGPSVRNKAPHMTATRTPSAQPLYYILNDAFEPLPIDDVLEWSEWCRRHRVLGQDSLPGNIFVSTVFVGVDTRDAFDFGPPLLWETMIFGGPQNRYQERYASREEALNGHRRAIQLASQSPRRG